MQKPLFVPWLIFDPFVELKRPIQPPISVLCEAAAAAGDHIVWKILPHDEAFVFLFAGIARAELFDVTFWAGHFFFLFCFSARSQMASVAPHPHPEHPYQLAGAPSNVACLNHS